MSGKLGKHSLLRWAKLIFGALTLFAGAQAYLEWSSADRLRELIAQSTEAVALIEGDERYRRHETWVSVAWRDSRGEMRRAKAFMPSSEQAFSQGGRDYVRIRYFEGSRAPMIITDPQRSIARAERGRTDALLFVVGSLAGLFGSFVLSSIFRRPTA